MERTRSGAYQPFAPIALAGYSSRTETVQFYTRGDEEQPPQIIRETQPYRFTITMRDVADDRRGPATPRFRGGVPQYDARAFTTGTLRPFPTDLPPGRQGR